MDSSPRSYVGHLNVHAKHSFRLNGAISCFDRDSLFGAIEGD